jgi:hypothetical protein
MANNKNYTFGGDFKSHRVLIEGSDLSTIVSEIEIYQDITTPFWTASVSFFDTQNRLMQDAIIQGSKVTIQIEDSTNKQTFKFMVYEISDREMIGQQKYVYRIKCIDEAFFKDQKQRINKHYDDKKASDIFKEVINKIGGSGKVDETKDKFSIIVPNLSPMATAEWLATWATKKVQEFTGLTDDYGLEYTREGANAEQADYIVFQQDHGKWSFRPLEKMFIDKSGKLPNLVQRPANLKEDEAGEKEPEDFKYSMQGYRFISHFNAITNSISGGFGSTAIVHDIKNKNAKLHTYTYSQDNKKDYSKKPFTNIDGMSKTNIVYQPYLDYSIESGKDTISTKYYKWRGSRRSNLLKLDTNRLIVSIAGRIDIYDQLGKMVTVDLPKNNDEDDGKYYDTHYKFAWIILAMRHVWTQKSFMTYIELGKKRLDKSI